MDELVNITVRVDPVFKAEVEELFEGLGLSIDEAIHLFLEESLLKGKLPFEIFSDRTLHDLAAVRPENLKDMLLIEGAGILNVLKFGPVFLKEIRYWNHTH